MISSVERPKTFRTIMHIPMTTYITTLCSTSFLLLIFLLAVHLLLRALRWMVARQILYQIQLFEAYVCLDNFCHHGNKGWGTTLVPPPPLLALFSLATLVPHLLPNWRVSILFSICPAALTSYHCSRWYLTLSSSQSQSLNLIPYFLKHNKHASFVCWLSYLLP